MANQLSGQTGATPRLYARHLRHRAFSRVGVKSDQMTAWLALMAAGLSTTQAVVFADLKAGQNADYIRQSAGYPKL